MQSYIISNQNDEYWTGKKFIENELITEENPNFQFMGFDSPEEAKFFNPIFQNLPEIKIWKCESKEPVFKNWIYLLNKSILPLSICETEDLTDLQYTAMAILGILSVIRNNKVRCFCFDYLRDKNRKPETAEKLYNKLSEPNKNIRPEEEYVGPVWSLLKGIKNQNFKYHCTISLYRSICDSNSTDKPLNFQTIYQAVRNLSLIEIADRIKNNTSIV